MLLLGGLISSGLVQNVTSKKQIDYPKASLISEQQIGKIKVDIAGAINRPGVYTLNTGARMEQEHIVRVAGSFSNNVNSQYISKQFNLSQKLSNGQKIYIPLAGEEGKISTNLLRNNYNSLVGINCGTLDQLDALPGIGPVIAQKIINARPYSSLGELTQKRHLADQFMKKLDI